MSGTVYVVCCGPDDVLLVHEGAFARWDDLDHLTNGTVKSYTSLVRARRVAARWGRPDIQVGVVWAATSDEFGDAVEAPRTVGWLPIEQES